MAVLREQEAVAYLERVKSVINPESHKFSYLPLIHTMLDIEAVFIQKLATDEHTKQLADVSIQPDGFPELNSWFVDLNQAFKVIDQLRALRAQAMIPLMQQFANASPDGIIQVSENIAPAFDQDKALTKAHEGLTTGQRKMLQSKQDLPLMTRKEAPGLVVVYDRDVEAKIKKQKQENNGHVSTSDISAGYFYNLPIYAGLKYIDANPADDRSTRTPAILYAPLASDPGEVLKVSTIQVLTPSITLINHDYDTYARGYHIDIQRQFRGDVRREGDALVPLGDYETLKKLTNLLTSRLSTMEAFLAIDTSELSTAQIDALLDSLPQFNSLVIEIVEFSQRIINGSDISTAKFVECNTDFANRLSTVFNAIDDDNIRRKLQHAMASETILVHEQVKKIAGSANSVGIYQDDEVQDNPSSRRRFTYPWQKRR